MVTTTTLFETYYKSKRLDPQKIEETILPLRKQGKKIASLNGSFDLLHAGHLHILFEAKAQADILIVALNSDTSIQQYKGENRPIIALEDRMKMLTAISCVDFVTWFNETDPRAILQKIKPDIHINGSEYGPNCIEAEIVKNIHLVDLVEGLSTSNIINKIKSGSKA